MPHAAPLRPALRSACRTPPLFGRLPPSPHHAVLHPTYPFALLLPHIFTAPFHPTRPRTLAPAAALAAVPLHHSPHPPHHTAFLSVPVLNHTRMPPYPPPHLPRTPAQKKKSGVAPLSAEPLRIVIRHLVPKGYLPINSTLRLMKAVSCSPASMPFDSRARSISCLTISFLPPISRRRPSR